MVEQEISQQEIHLFVSGPISVTFPEKLCSKKE